MIYIDSHQHFWVYEPIKHSWINDEMKVIQRDFLPKDLKPIYEDCDIDACIAVQADQTEVETDFLISIAETHDFVKGVVGWVDLQSADLEERLSHYKNSEYVKGFRHVVQDEPDPLFMLRPAFQRGIGMLEKFNFTYDILIFPTQMAAAIQTVKNFPNQAFVLDHIAKPYIQKQEIKEWAKNMKTLARFDNVNCKLSGMVTEHDWKNWQYQDFVPYLDVAMETFGSDRLMYGSDWPVCQLAGNYQQVKELMNTYVTHLSATEQEDIWGLTASRFYGI